jgi:hypothetical protein
LCPVGRNFKCEDVGESSIAVPEKIENRIMI